MITHLVSDLEASTLLKFLSVSRVTSDRHAQAAGGGAFTAISAAKAGVPINAMGDSGC